MMNFRRILLGSGSHLLKRANTMVVTPAWTGVDISHLLKRACTTVSASVSADLFATSDSDGVSVSAEVAASRMQRKKRVAASRMLRKKRKMFEKLQNLKETGGTVVETLNEIMMREEEEGVSITQSDIARWAMRLYKDEKYRQALEMFEWMERNNMTFSPFELAIFVELLGKMDGYVAARDLFKKVDPNFDHMNSREKNYHAYQKLENMLKGNGRNSFRGNGRRGYLNDRRYDGRVVQCMVDLDGNI